MACTGILKERKTFPTSSFLSGLSCASVLVNSLPKLTQRSLWFCFRHFHRKQLGFGRWEASGTSLVKNSSHLFWHFCYEQNDFMFSWFLFGPINEFPLKKKKSFLIFLFKLLVCIVFIFKQNQINYKNYI